MNSKEQLLISTIFDTKFKEQKDVSIEELINFIANPPFKKIGVFDVDTFYPSSERLKLAMKINALIASPSPQNIPDKSPADTPILFLITFYILLQILTRSLVSVFSISSKVCSLFFFINRPQTP